ncbi:MAG: hypothetical protein CBD29_07275 [Synechococcus sp. TMED169]|jgi:putative oxidoreductase|nr:MAG: hypothetical protein CBD29_07275 [Synechococcus sp. TMED169]
MQVMARSLGFLVLRVCVGSVLIHHGFDKLADIQGFADSVVKPLHLPFPVLLAYIAAYSEIVGSWLMIFGLGARLGALAVLGTISVAIYHSIVVTGGFNIYALELLILYFGGSACVVLNGAGRFSFDYLIIRAIGMSSSPLRAFVLRRPKLDELEDLVGVSVASSKSDQSEAVQA